MLLVAMLLKFSLGVKWAIGCNREQVCQVYNAYSQYDCFSEPSKTNPDSFQEGLPGLVVPAYVLESNQGFFMLAESLKRKLKGIRQMSKKFSNNHDQEMV